MSSALLVEGLSSALSISRREVREAFDAIEEKLGAMKMDLSRRISCALSSSNGSSEGAYAVAEVGGQVAFGDRDMLKLVMGVAGTIWGAAIVSSTLTATGAVVIMGGAITLPVAVAFLFGLIVMFICGRYTLGVVREILNKLGEFSSNM